MVKRLRTDFGIYAVCGTGRNISMLFPVTEHIAKSARHTTLYATQAQNGGKLAMPVLFLHGDYDYTCETVVSRLAEPMRQDCSNLSEVIIQSGHWMAQEKPVEVNAAIAKWLATALPKLWPG